jgi:hypothetical protein
VEIIQTSNKPSSRASLDISMATMPGDLDTLTRLADELDA